MLYRIAQAVNASYGLTVAWGYIGMFTIACMLLFVFPQITLLLLFLGLASLALTITGGWLVDAATRALARNALHANRCPRCGTPSRDLIETGAAWLCDQCGSEFKVGGGEVSRRERARFVETPPDLVQHVIYDEQDEAGEEWRTVSR